MRMRGFSLRRTPVKKVRLIEAFLGVTPKGRFVVNETLRLGEGQHDGISGDCANVGHRDGVLSDGAGIVRAQRRGWERVGVAGI